MDPKSVTRRILNYAIKDFAVSPPQPAIPSSLLVYFSVFAESAGLALSVRRAGDRSQHPLDEDPPLHQPPQPRRQLRRAAPLPGDQLLR